MKALFKKQILIILCAAAGISLMAAGDEAKPAEQARQYYVRQLDSLQAALSSFSNAALLAPEDAIKNHFVQCRNVYKRVEGFTEYYYPAAATKINGAPLLEAEASEPEEPVHPTGFQVLEEPVFKPLTQESRLVIRNEISSITGQVARLKKYVAVLEMSDEEVFDALRLNCYRLIAKGITAFDCPVALSAIGEAATTIQAMQEVLSYYNLPESLAGKGRAAMNYLRQPGVSFNGFNRAVFLKDYLNPYLSALYDWQKDKGIAFIQAQRAVRTEARHVFEADAFNPYFFAPSGAADATPELIALGKKLFYEPMISGTGNRSCGTCHKPELAFTDGLTTNTTLSGNRTLLRNTPTLINAALQPAQFADSRIAFLEDQVHDVVSNREEMGGDFERILARLKADKDYKKGFAAAFPQSSMPWSKAAVRMAMAAYVRSLVALNAPFDRYMRGDATAVNDEAIAGFNLFMGKAKCGTCHYAPLFSGAVPPLFDKIESEVIGVPAKPDTANATMDGDIGKFALYNMPHQQYSFKTAGLRNSGITAPYMHNGIYKTLEEVLDFYNRGGAAGIGIELDNQTLSPDALNLTQQEQKAIITFLHALTDTSGFSSHAVSQN